MLEKDGYGQGCSDMKWCQSTKVEIKNIRVKAGLCPAFTGYKRFRLLEKGRYGMLITSIDIIPIIAIIALGYFLQNHGWFGERPTYRG